MTPQDDVNNLKDIVNRINHFIKQFDDTALGDLYSFSRQLTLLQDIVRDELKNRCNLRAVNGWQLTQQKGAREIRDFTAAYQAFADIITQQEFDDCCTLVLTKLERLFTDYMMTKFPGITPEDCKQQFNERITPLVTYKPSRETLVRTFQ